MVLGVLLLVSLLSSVSSQNDDLTSAAPPPAPRGCGPAVAPAYRVLCDLEAAWGVALEAAACGGALAAMALVLVLLARRRRVRDPARRSGLAPLLLTLASLLGLFALAPAFLAGPSPALCILRRALWAPLHALGFSGLLAQGVRLRRLASGRRSPPGGSLAGLALALAAVQAVASGEWVLLTVAREGHAPCDYPALDFALVCCYTLALLLAAMGVSLAVVLCSGGGGEEEEEEGGGGGGGEKRGWRSNGVWLFLSCLASALLWVGWLGFYLYGDQAPRAGPGGARRARPGGGWAAGAAAEWDEPALAVALVAQGWLLLLFHAIPEAHLCLRSPPPPQAAAHGYFDGGQAPPPRRFAEETRPHPVRQFAAENQAFSIEEHSAALRGGAYHDSHGGVRPGIPFRGHVYQPTEMALVMNGGKMPTAPVNYTGRQLW